MKNQTVVANFGQNRAHAMRYAWHHANMGHPTKLYREERAWFVQVTFG